MTLLLITVCLSALSCLDASSSQTQTVLIPASEFSQLFGLTLQQSKVAVNEFKIDRYPVSRYQFQTFLKAHPEWELKNVFELYKDPYYLKDFKVSKTQSQRRLSERQPMTSISWYAASAYCEAQGGRLPNTLEWEKVAAASAELKDASRDREFNKKILDWYALSGHRQKKSLGQSTPNIYGIHDLHGLIWEWTSDFNSFFMNFDNRSDGEQSNDFFCGSAALGAKDKEGYAAFMRYAFRSSLKANYANENLGFRCAYSIEKEKDNSHAKK